jgi:hypothetical protein
MKNKNLIYLLTCIFACSLLACNQKKDKQPMVVMPAAKKDSPVKSMTLDQLQFDSKKDLVCGMPISAGVSGFLYL